MTSYSSSAVEAAKRRAREASKKGSLLSTSNRRKPFRNAKPSNTAAKNQHNQLFSVFSNRKDVALSVSTRTNFDDDTKENDIMNVSVRFKREDELFPQNSFFFQQRHGKLDLREISRVDIEKVIETVDIDTLQQFLENLTFSEISESDLRNYTDEAFVKLFRLSQLTIEYLLNVQHTLFSYVSKLEGNMSSLSQEQNLASKKLIEQGEQLKNLKREIRQKKRTLRTYEFLLTQQSAKKGNEIVNEEVLSSDTSTIERQMNIKHSLIGAHERLLDEERRRREGKKKEEEDYKKRTLEEEKKNILEALQQQMEATRKEIMMEIEKEREELRNREKEIERAGITLEEKLRIKFCQYVEDQNEQETRENCITQGKQQKKKISWAGELEDDEISFNVEQILKNDDNIKDAFEKTMAENERLQQKIKALESKECQRATLLAEKPEYESSFIETKEVVSKENEITDAKLDSDINETIPRENEEDKKEQLILALANSKVSSTTLSARDLQLRRVLRMVRRKVQQKYFFFWRIFTIKKMQIIESNRIDMEERVRRKLAAENDEDNDDTLFFKPSYDWQIVPQGVDIGSFSSLLETKNSRVRIPRTFPCSVQVFRSADEGKVLKRITFDAERNMTIFDCRVCLSHLLKENLESVSLCRNYSDPPLPDGLTVEVADLFNRSPVVVLSEKVADEAIDDIVRRYQKYMKGETVEIEDSEAEVGEKSVQEEMIQIRKNLESEIEKELAKELPLPDEIHEQIEVHKDISSAGSSPHHIRKPELPVKPKAIKNPEIQHVKRQVTSLYRKTAVDFLSVKLDGTEFDYRHLALDSGTSKTETSLSSAGLPSRLDTSLSDAHSHFDVSARADAYELETPHTAAEGLSSVASDAGFTNRAGSTGNEREISKLLSAIQSDEDSDLDQDSPHEY